MEIETKVMENLRKSFLEMKNNLTFEDFFAFWLKEIQKESITEAVEKVTKILDDCFKEYYDK